MISPTPRQQAGYLRRLLRRGELQIFDARSNRPVQALIELCGDIVRVTPVAPREGVACSTEEARWNALADRLRAVLSAEAAEELTSAVEAEHREAKLLESFEK